MRLRDNLIQLACLPVGLITGAGIGALIGMPRNTAIGAVLGGFLGVVAALILSGAVIGIIRGRNATRARKP